MATVLLLALGMPAMTVAFYRAKLRPDRIRAQAKGQQADDWEQFGKAWPVAVYEAKARRAGVTTLCLLPVCALVPMVVILLDGS